MFIKGLLFMSNGNEFLTYKLVYMFVWKSFQQDWHSLYWLWNAWSMGSYFGFLVSLSELCISNWIGDDQWCLLPPLFGVGSNYSERFRGEMHLNRCSKYIFRHWGFCKTSQTAVNASTPKNNTGNLSRSSVSELVQILRRQYCIRSLQLLPQKSSKLYSP